MTLSEFKKYFNLQKNFEFQKIQNDLKLSKYIVKAKRTFLGIGILGCVFFFTFASSSYDNYNNIIDNLCLKYKIYSFKLKILSDRNTKITYLMNILTTNVD